MVFPCRSLTRDVARDITKKELARPGIAHRNIFVRVTESAVEHVVENGYDPKYGARATKRFIERSSPVALLNARAIASQRPFRIDPLDSIRAIPIGT